jgi:hypothetical protein
MPRPKHDESLNYDKSIVTDFRDDRDHGGTILYGSAIKRLVMGSLSVVSEARVSKLLTRAQVCLRAFDTTT